MLALDATSTSCNARAWVRAFGGAWPAGFFAAPGDGGGGPLASLAGGALDGQFRFWRGRSGRRYVCSVYDRAACPAYEHAILIVAAVAPDGARHLLFIAETGCFPEIALAKAEQAARGHGRVEFHVHLLARSAAARAALLADFAHLGAS
jgi:hypothetical protein